MQNGTKARQEQALVSIHQYANNTNGVCTRKALKYNRTGRLPALLTSAPETSQESNPEDVFSVFLDCSKTMITVTGT